MSIFKKKEKEVDIEKVKLMDGAIVAMMKTMKEFSDAYSRLKERVQNENEFLDCLVIEEHVIEEPEHKEDIEGMYEIINDDYVLVLRDSWYGIAYIQSVYWDER